MKGDHQSFFYIRMAEGIIAVSKAAGRIQKNDRAQDPMQPGHVR